MLTLLFLVLISSGLQVESFEIPVLDSLTNLFEFVHDMYSKLNEAHDSYNKFQTSASLEDIMTTVSEISRDVNTLVARIERKLDVIVQTLLNRLPLAKKIDDDFQSLHRKIIRIDSLYSDFQTYVKDRDEFNNATLKDFAKSITSHRSDDVNDILIQIHGIIFPGRGWNLKESLVLLLSKETQMNRLDLCDNGSPPQERLYELYETIVLTEIRVYLMVGFAYTLRSTFEKGKFMREVLHREQQFELRVTQYLNVFKMAMTWAPRTLRRCDPPQGHIRDKTFFEFERFINTYILQEDALNRDFNCKGSCWDQPDPGRRHYGCNGFQCNGDDGVGCRGTITGCSGAGEMDICIAQLVPPAMWSPRRYYWFKDSSGKLSGNNAGGCNGRRRKPDWFWKHRFWTCDVCVCICIDDSWLSDAYHFVSLREVVSDVNDTRIVTGLKFIRSDWVVQVQIQQGRLAQDGKMEAHTVTWKEPEKIQFEPALSRGAYRHVFSLYTPDTPDVNSTLYEDKDVAVFYYKTKTINLDELRAPEEHVITGVRFSKVSGKSPNDAAIQLEIRVTPFDYRKGTLLNVDSSIWITPDDMKNDLSAYQQERSEVAQPWDSRSPLDALVSVPEFTPNKYIKIERTSDRHDAGQTVLPLLDALEVAPNPPLPLVGVNFFHKRADGYGGFLSWQIETVDRTAYIELPEQDKTF